MRPWDVPFLPDTCSRCGATWDGRTFGFSPQHRIVDLVCVAGHEVRFELTVEQLLEFERVVVPWTGDKPARLVGGPLAGHVQMAPGTHPSNVVTTDTGEQYRYVREDSDAYVYEHVPQRPGNRAPRLKRLLGRRNSPGE